MNQRNFENVGRFLIILFVSCAILCFFSWICFNMYSGIQESELRELEKEKYNLEIQKMKKEYELIIKQLNEE